jgi:hypothetical protein
MEKIFRIEVGLLAFPHIVSIISGLPFDIWIQSWMSFDENLILRY